MSCIEPDMDDQGQAMFKRCMNGYRWSLDMKERLLTSDRHYMAPDILAQTIINLFEIYETLTGNAVPHVLIQQQQEKDARNAHA